MNLRKFLLLGGGVYLLLFALAIAFIAVRRSAKPAGPATPDLGVVQAPVQTEQPTSTTPGGEPAITPTSAFPGTPVATRTGTSIPTEALTPAPSRTPTPTPTQTPALTATSTGTPTFTQTPALGSMSGRVTLGGEPISIGVSLSLEDINYQLISRVLVVDDGSFRIGNLPLSEQGYNLVFSQEQNPGFEIDDVVSWAWLGPIAVTSGAEIQLPDFEIGLLGFGQTHPEPEATLSAASITPTNPLLFEWSPYPGAISYWVDLARGEEQELVWQSALVASTSTPFDGRLADGSLITPGDYWWAIGALRPQGPYTLTVYAYLAALTVEP